MDHDTEAGAQTFGDLVRDYVRHPDDERLHALRKAVTRSSSFDPDLELHSAMAPLLRRGDHVNEWMVVSTCNRVEIYGEVATFHGAVTQMSESLCAATGLDLEEVGDSLYAHYEERAERLP